MENDEGSPAQQRAERLYEQEDIIHKSKLMESDYRENLIDMISRASLSFRCKITLIALVNMAFDRNVILANNKSLLLRKMQLQQALNKAQLSYTRPDIMNPIIVSIHENIYQHFNDYVSRSLGMMERERQAEKRTVQKVTYEDELEKRRQDQPKRGFGLNPFKPADNNEEEQWR